MSQVERFEVDLDANDNRFAIGDHAHTVELGR